MPANRRPGILHADSRHRDVQDEHLRGILEARVRALDGLEGPDHEAGAHDEDKRQRHLADDQGVAGQVPLTAGAPAAPPFLQRADQIEPSAAHDGEEPEDDAREERYGQRERECARVDRNRIETRQFDRRHRHQQAQPGLGQADSDRTAEQAQ